MTRARELELLEAVRDAWTAVGRALETDGALELLESDGRGPDGHELELAAVEDLEAAGECLQRASLALQLVRARRDLEEAEYALERARAEAEAEELALPL